MTQQQTERDDALIAEARKNIEKICPALKDDTRTIAAEALHLERSGWTPPPKPDRYLQVWKEAKDACIYPNRTEHESDQASAAVLRRHFEPPSDVVALLETFSADIVDVQSRYVIVHQLRASADIQDRQIKAETGWADTSDRAFLMRKSADAIEAFADFILQLKGDQ